MTDTVTEIPPAGRKVGPMLFLRQMVAELRKVVYPTRREVVTYTWVVLVFVIVIMLFVTGLDNLFGRLVLWMFSSK